MNTKISYLYRDGSNYNRDHAVVVAGVITFEDVFSFLDEDTYFIPSQVGLRDLQTDFGALTGDDHPWHELREDDFAPTDARPTVAVTAEQLKERFLTVTWDDAWPVVR